MTPISTPLKLSNGAMADLVCTMIILCRGVDIENKPIWAYLCMKPSMANAFNHARERGDCDIADYGTVLESGEGDDPPLDVQKIMERDFGVNHLLEKQLLESIH